MNKPFPKNQQLAHQNFDLDGVQDSQAFNEAIDRDFGTATDNFDGDSVSRRRWLQIMGASLALGSMSGCRYEEEKIAPFAFRPVDRIPGIPQQYASMIELSGVAQPIVATSYDGRPIKLDGNKKHPQSMGASSTFTQARMLEFYDPDRMRTGAMLKTRENSRVTYWDDASFDDVFDSLKSGLSNLSKVAVLAEPSQSPSLMRLQKAFTDKGGKWFHFGGVSDDNARAGAKAAFGKAVRVHNHFDKAKVIISLDSDFMGVDTNSVGNAVAFAKTRDADAAAQGTGFMSRLYVVESQHTVTGSAADHRISVQSSKIAGFLAALVAAIDSRQQGQEVDKTLPYRERLLAAMAQDIVDNAAESLIVAGEYQPAAVHAAVHALNKKLGNAGSTVTYSDVPDADRDGCLDSIKAFAQAASNGEIETLIVLGGNPVYSAPQDLNIGDAIGSVKNRVHATCFKNETSQACETVVDMAHALETWKDGLAADGSICIGQPLINPLFDSKSNLEILSAIIGEPSDSQTIVKTTAGLSINDWKQAVHDGFVKGSEAKASGASAGAMPELEADDAWKTPWDGETIEFVFNTSPSMYDGQFANNAWMQELPDFTTKITWDNAALVSPKTAKALGLAQHTKATFELGGEVTLPVHVQPGQADGSIGLAIGYGRKMAGRVGGNKELAVKPVGEDVSPLRSSENWVMAGGLSSSNVTPTGTVYKLAIVQEPWDIDSVGRDEIQARMFRNKDKTETDRSSLIREGSFASFTEFAEKHKDAFSGEAHGEQGHDEHADGADHDHASEKLKSTALPIITNVSFNPNGARPDDVAADDHAHEDGAHDHAEGESHDHEGESHEGGDAHAQEGDDHGHGHGGHEGHVEGSERDPEDSVHRTAWPEAFHMHHSLFDLTKGTREIYKETDATHTNVWGKAIDLNKCIGCNSCVVACQSENNVPVVGRDDVRRGREMHWIRIDRYFGNNLYNEQAADEDDKQIVHQPIACHHCENAPCETVCPVAATVHSNEGLNDMVYNRCIGTRYCGNNCPYKVRRFNFFNYADAKTFLKYPGADKLPAGDRNLQNLMMNPEVSIRSRGVMEKCTYCVQRIQNTKIQAKAEGREIGNNEITVACQDACPTKAISFGDLNRVGSEVHADHHNPRRYSMLDELNNRPRTVYLARVRNVHPAMIDFDDRDSVHAPYGGEAAH